MIQKFTDTNKKKHFRYIDTFMKEKIAKRKFDKGMRIMLEFLPRVIGPRLKTS